MKTRLPPGDFPADYSERIDTDLTRSLLRRLVSELALIREDRQLVTQALDRIDLRITKLALESKTLRGKLNRTHKELMKQIEARKAKEKS